MKIIYSDPHRGSYRSVRACAAEEEEQAEERGLHIDAGLAWWEIYSDSFNLILKLNPPPKQLTIVEKSRAKFIDLFAILVAYTPLSVKICFLLWKL